MCGVFFSDGSLTGDMILRQFDHDALCCESIGSQVYGLAMDTGGNNAKFASRLRNGKAFPDGLMRIEKELCYTKKQL